MTDEKIPLSEANELLTLGEIDAIERHFGRAYGLPVGTDGGMTPMQTTKAVAWAFQRRADLAADRPLTNWKDIDAWQVKALDGFFAPEPIEVDPDDPETASGKGDSDAG